MASCKHGHNVNEDDSLTWIISDQLLVLNEIKFTQQQQLEKKAYDIT